MNHHYHTFIIEMIKHGDKQRAYNKAYPKTKGQSAIKGGERLLRIPQIAAEIKEAIYTIHGEAYAKACAVHEGIREIKILSIMKKREILAQLATCEMKVGRYVKGDNGYIMVYEDPRPRDIIKCIEVDTKLEEMLNNLRNIEDIKLSRFDIYIDGRPADDPTAPINPNIPQGLVMLPRKKKNIPEIPGNKMEQNTSETLRLCETAVQISPEIIGNKKEHPDSYRDQEINSPFEDPSEWPVRAEGVSHRLTGDVDSRLTLANENIPDFTGNKKEQMLPETLAHPLSALGGEPEALTLMPEEAIDSRPLLAPETLLLQKTEFLEEKQQRRAKDPLYDSFYKDFIRRREQAPPPRVYTDEEIQSIRETGSPTRPLFLETLKIPKSGKLIFKSKRNWDDEF